ncbi:MAG: hypothetical protein V1826_02000 [bacterium]
MKKQEKIIDFTGMYFRPERYPIERLRRKIRSSSRGEHHKVARNVRSIVGQLLGF